MTEERKMIIFKKQTSVLNMLKNFHLLDKELVRLHCLERMTAYLFKFERNSKGVIRWEYIQERNPESFLENRIKEFNVPLEQQKQLEFFVDMLKNAYVVQPVSECDLYDKYICLYNRYRDHSIFREIFESFNDHSPSEEFEFYEALFFYTLSVSEHFNFSFDKIDSKDSISFGYEEKMLIDPLFNGVRDIDVTGINTSIVDGTNTLGLVGYDELCHYTLYRVRPIVQFTEEE